MHRPFFAATFVSLATVLVSGHPAQAFAAPQGTPATQAAATGLTAEQINNRIDEVFNELEKLNERMAKEAGASADGAARLERASQEVAMKAIKGVNLASLDATAFAHALAYVARVGDDHDEELQALAGGARCEDVIDGGWRP